MIVYNVTINIDDEVHDEWVAWMKKEHIPAVMQCGLFTQARMSKMLVDEESGTTYSIQYVANTMLDYEKYVKDFAPALQAETQLRFKDKFVAYRSIMEVIVQF